MSTTGPTGKDWQTHVACLCRIECMVRGETYQPIPDKVNGDGGLEGISSDGDGYQCYADQDSVSTQDRVKKQKDKITTDLAKLEKHADFWDSVFVLHKLKKWFLVIPDMPDKALVAHARKHAKRIRELGLPFVDPSFEAFVVTDDHFQNAKDRRAKESATPFDVAPDNVSDRDLEAMKFDFVANIERKLGQVFQGSTRTTIPARRDEYLKWYLEHENVLSKILDQDPELFERLKNFCAQQQETVKFDSGIDDAAPKSRLSNVHRALKDDLDRDFKRLGTATLALVARGSIASWLGNCPLEFISGTDHE